jgi:hypothetical protein
MAGVTFGVWPVYTVCNNRTGELGNRRAERTADAVDPPNLIWVIPAEGSLT